MVDDLVVRVNRPAGGHVVRKPDSARAQALGIACGAAGTRRGLLAGMRPLPPPHPLEAQPSFVAIVDAMPPLAQLAARVANQALVRSLAIACGDLADGFAAPPHSRRRLDAHRRAWTSLRAIDRAVGEAARTRRAPGDIVRKAQRAIDRADVLVGALLP